MSQGTSCHCGKRDAWRVTTYKANFSAFNGYRYTPSDYSEIVCSSERGGCGSRWRTKANYVESLPRASYAPDLRFYVQEPHNEGIAVIDREKSALVISSFGDTAREARTALLKVADALNAAVDVNYGMARNNYFKMVPPVLAWRVIEYLSMLYREAAYAQL